MPFLDTGGLKVVERLPGWKGRFFHTATMTFADYEFTASSTIHEHFHPDSREAHSAMCLPHYFAGFGPTE